MFKKRKLKEKCEIRSVEVEFVIFQLEFAATTLGKINFLAGLRTHTQTGARTHLHTRKQTQVQADLGAHPPWWTRNQTRTWALDTPLSLPSSSFVHNSCCPQLCRACTFVFVFCIDFLHTHNVAVAKDAQQQKNANALTHTLTHTNALAQHAKS